MNTPEEIVASNPQINHQLPTPRVIEATDDVINLDEPFTLELAPVNAIAYSHVLLMFLNADGSLSPQAIASLPVVDGEPTTHVVDNAQLSPPFNRDQSAVLQGYLRLKDEGLWQRTPDSVIYTF